MDPSVNIFLKIQAIILIYC